ncbi:DUF427 domain-containing protein [Nocardiopsis sp. NRRL B-16309]|uniref:DUF427 domain-containing protein n=1 Tax=Nocardiopsis sp. NRRL B-16309 TaxID=1519494 RepID=UPI0009ECB68F|nr:DUF427 domain-containing protein [Nocardiopsis sp. NRRL B-16309]
MIRLVWNGVVPAEAGRTVAVEGDHYFPPDSVRGERLTDSASRTLCFWKRVAHDDGVTVDGQTSSDAAWHYPEPSPPTRRFKGHVAFYPGASIERTDEECSRERGGPGRHGDARQEGSGRDRPRSLLGGRA